MHESVCSRERKGNEDMEKERERERETTCELMAWVCANKYVSLLDRCVSRPQDGGRGSNPCPSPCRWQSAEQHQARLGLLQSNQSVSLAVSAAAAAALTVSGG